MTAEGGPEELATALAGGGVVLVHFRAAWSGPCLLMAPIVDEVAALRPDVTVVAVDTHAHPGITDEWGVRTVPTFHLRVDGEPGGALVGAQPKPRLLAAVDEALARRT